MTCSRPLFAAIVAVLVSASAVGAAGAAELQIPIMNAPLPVNTPGDITSPGEPFNPFAPGDPGPLDSYPLTATRPPVELSCKIIPLADGMFAVSVVNTSGADLAEGMTIIWTIDPTGQSVDTELVSTVAAGKSVNFPPMDPAGLDRSTFTCKAQAVFP